MKRFFHLPAVLCTPRGCPQQPLLVCFRQGLTPLLQREGGQGGCQGRDRGKRSQEQVLNRGLPPPVRVLPWGAAACSTSGPFGVPRAGGLL